MGQCEVLWPSLSLVKDKQLPLQLWLRMLPFQWQNKQIVIILAYIAQRHTNEWGIYTEPVVKPVWCIIRQECVLSRACMCRTYKKRELKKFWIDNQQTELKKWSHVWGLAVAVIPLSLSLLSLFSLSLSLSLFSLSVCVCVCWHRSGIQPTQRATEEYFTSTSGVSENGWTLLLTTISPPG